MGVCVYHARSMVNAGNGDRKRYLSMGANETKSLHYQIWIFDKKMQTHKFCKPATLSGVKRYLISLERVCYLRLNL